MAAHTKDENTIYQSYPNGTALILTKEGEPRRYFVAFAMADGTYLKTVLEPEFITKAIEFLRGATDA